MANGQLLLMQVLVNHRTASASEIVRSSNFLSFADVLKVYNHVIINFRSLRLFMTTAKLFLWEKGLLARFGHELFV